MTTTAVPTVAARPVSTTAATPILRAGVKAGAAAALATTVFAAAAHGAGVPLEIKGEMIPLVGFAQLTFVCTLVGIGIAALCRRARAPRRRFVQVTLVLTALSFVPDVVANATTTTKVALVATHVIAAAIVIPRLAGRLGD